MSMSPSDPTRTLPSSRYSFDARGRGLVTAAQGIRTGCGGRDRGEAQAINPMGAYTGRGLTGGFGVPLLSPDSIRDIVVSGGDACGGVSAAWAGSSRAAMNPRPSGPEAVHPSAGGQRAHPGHGDRVRHGSEQPYRGLPVLVGIRGGAASRTAGSRAGVNACGPHEVTLHARIHSSHSILLAVEWILSPKVGYI